VRVLISIRRRFLHIGVPIVRAQLETGIVGRNAGRLPGGGYIEPRPEFRFSKLVTNLAVGLLELFAMFIKLPLTGLCLIERFGNCPLRNRRFTVRPGEPIRLLRCRWQHKIPAQQRQYDEMTVIIHVLGLPWIHGRTYSPPVVP
jgi:hypothetical protein